MTVKIDITDTDLAPAIQNHLDGGCGVRDYIIGAVQYFNKAREAEANGNNQMGYGDKARFKSYNTVLSPAEYI